MAKLMKLADIIIGTRARKDMGDVASLAYSIKQYGMLHPIVVRPDGTLIAGQRRIEAARLINMAEVPAVVIDLDDLLHAELDENTERKSFTPTEAVAIGRLLEEQEKAVLKEAQRISGLRLGLRRRQGHDPGKLPASLAPRGEVRERVGAAVGMSGRTYELAKQVTAAADENPETFGDLPAMMDHASIFTAYKELQRRRSRANGNVEPVNEKQKPPRHPIFRKMHYPKPNRALERAMPILAGACDVLEQLEMEELDATRTPQWSADLKKFAQRLSRIATRLGNR